MKTLTFTFVFTASLGAALVACEGAPPPPPPAPPPAAAAKPKPAPVAAAPALLPDGGTAPADTQQYIYSYNPVGKRDPFRSFFDELPVKGDKASEDKLPVCSEPLCQFDIEQLKLVAVVSGDANPVAMLEDPTMIGHLVHRNTKVGKQGGKVSQISRDCITVTEFFLSPDGKMNPNKVNICIKQEATRAGVFDLMNNKNIE